MRKLTVLALAVILLSACGSEKKAPTPAAEPAIPVSTVNTKASNSYAEAQAAAVAAIDIASQKRSVWTTSIQLINDAAKAAADGDEALAIVLADEARIHAELAVIQAEESAKTWRDAVISD